jgi:ATP-dependent Lhr-like helicase
MGRSGRTDDAPSIIRIYVEETDLGSDPPPQDLIRGELLQAVAMVELLIEGWNEPPSPSAMHLSTLVQQVLSLAAQYGGFRAREAWSLLAQQGPFREVTADDFGSLLRSLARHDLIVQDHDGTIVLGLSGERLVNHYEFYAAFTSSEEYRLVTRGKTLGTLPIAMPLVIGQLMIFAGRRWRVLQVDDERKVVELVAAPGGKAPSFAGGAAAPVHDRVRQKMRSLLQSDEVPRYLNDGAERLLAEARASYDELALDRRSIIEHGDDTIVFPWAGDRAMGTMLLLLISKRLDAMLDGVALTVRGAGADSVRATLTDVCDGPAVNPLDLARVASNREREKHHRFLSDALLTRDYAAAEIDVDGALAGIARVLR